ncbi:MAG TPA: hypothetical protein VLD38_07575 [Nitrosopumilaceae archaeon]|nr:hypothetical protein [Nitrosopumilaceae archaeon]
MSIVSIMPHVIGESVNSLPSPRKQLTFGVPAHYIGCKENLILMNRGTGEAICIKSSSASRFIERGWTTLGEQVEIVGTLHIEQRKERGHFAFCEIYSIILNETEKNKIGKIKSDEVLLFTHRIVYPNDDSEIMYPGNKLTQQLEGKSVMVQGRILENQGNWCVNWHLDENGKEVIIPDTEPVIVPIKLGILNS